MRLRILWERKVSVDKNCYEGQKEYYFAVAIAWVSGFVKLAV